MTDHTPEALEALAGSHGANWPASARDALQAAAARIRWLEGPAIMHDQVRIAGVERERDAAREQLAALEPDWSEAPEWATHAGLEIRWYSKPDSIGRGGARINEDMVIRKYERPAPADPPAVSPKDSRAGGNTPVLDLANEADEYAPVEEAPPWMDNPEVIATMKDQEARDTGKSVPSEEVMRKLEGGETPRQRWERLKRNYAQSPAHVAGLPFVEIELFDLRWLLDLADTATREFPAGLAQAFEAALEKVETYHTIDLLRGDSLARHTFPVVVWDRDRWREIAQRLATDPGVLAACQAPRP
jgi:hypothetical protein